MEQDTNFAILTNFLKHSHNFVLILPNFYMFLIIYLPYPHLVG